MKSENITGPALDLDEPENRFSTWILKKISIRDLAIFLCDFLSRRGIDTVLSGGACVSIYTKNKHLSYDLDFVLLDYSQKRKIKGILEGLGFKPEGKHFRHSGTPFIVEFLSPPLSVGEEPVKQIFTIEENERKLKLLSPTDCVKDKLAAYYFWNERPALEQAVMVGLSQSIDFKEIERWSFHEGMENSGSALPGYLLVCPHARPQKNSIQKHPFHCRIPATKYWI